MKKKTVRLLLCVTLVAVMAAISSVTVFAAGDVAGAIENTWTQAQTQIKTVVNNVVFPVIDMILAILFFVKLGTAYFDYRKHGQFRIHSTGNPFCLSDFHSDRTAVYLDNIVRKRLKISGLFSF